MQYEKPASPKGKRRGKTQRLNKVTASLIGPALRARGISISRIITEWHHIAGAAASWSEPATIRFPQNQTDEGTLTVNVASGRGPEMQMMTDAIIRNVNKVFGYAAISRITITQTTLSASKAKSSPEPQRIVTEENAEKFTEAVEQISDDVSNDLRKALDNLGKSLASDPKLS